MRTDAEVNLHLIWAATRDRLDSYGKRVAENRDVDSALEFARYVFNSRLLELFEANAQPEPLKVDGPFLRWKVKELQQACTERYRLNDSRPHLEALQLQSVHEKLSLMAGYLSKLVVVRAEVSEANNEKVPQLKLIEGGRS